MVEVNVLGVIEGVEAGVHILRVEQKGRKHFIKRIKVSKLNKNIQVEIPEMAEEKFSYLFTSGDCVKEL